MNTNESTSARTSELRRQLVKMPMAIESATPSRGKNRLETNIGTAKQPRRRAKTVFALAAAAVGLMVLGQISLNVQSAHATDLLRTTAEQTMMVADPVPGPGEYLLVSKHANWLVSGDSFESFMEQQMIDVYVPGDVDREWVLDRDWGDKETRREVIHAPGGKFYDGYTWTSAEFPDLDALPRDGQAIYDFFNDSYTGASASRSESNFVRITDLLKNGLVPADLRAGLYKALALVPGVTITENVKNLDGKTGIAIGRTEILRGGMREEIIIDPDTGLVIGERDLMTIAAFGFGLNEVIGHTAIAYTMVDSVPEATSK